MAHAALLAELTEVIEQRARLPVLDIPEHLADESCSGLQIDEIAGRVRASWDLEDEPIGNMVRLLEVHGAIVVRLELADQGIDAFSWLGPDRPVVILDTGKGDRARSRFDAAHELGHLVMHRERAKRRIATWRSRPTASPARSCFPPNNLRLSGRLGG